MDNINALVQWAQESGVVLSGIRPAEVPHCGIGIIATRKIKAGDVLLEIPSQLTLRLNTVPQTIREKLGPDMPIHGMLAASLIIGDGLPDPWNAILPCQDDIEIRMPWWWPDEKQQQLPLEALKLLETQQEHLGDQWDLVSQAFPDVAFGDFHNAWLLVNSRTFHDSTPEAAPYPWWDRLALVPVADLFNHDDHDVGAYLVPSSSTDDKVLVVANKDIAAGEEVFISYGQRSNSFLLIHYGFCTGNNPHDGGFLDDAILPRLTNDQRRVLDETFLSGGFPLSPHGEDSHRTQAALRLMLCSPRDFWQYVRASCRYDLCIAQDPFIRRRRRSKPSACQAKVDAGLVELLERYEFTIDRKLEVVTLFGDEDAMGGMERLLAHLWRERKIAVRARMEELGGVIGGGGNQFPS